MRHDRAQASAGVLSKDMLMLGALFFLSGALALVYEAAWQREFTLLFGSSAPATATVLAAYFTGLGLGSFLLGKAACRIRNPLRLYGLLELAVGIGALLVTPILSRYAAFYPELFVRFGGGGTTFLMVKGTLAFAAIAIPTIAMGGTLPVLAQLFEQRRARFGELTGWLYLLNTAGAAVGAGIFPLLLGVYGMRNVIFGCVTLNIAIGLGAFLLARRSSYASAAPEQRTSAAKPSRVSLWTGLSFGSGFVLFVLQVGWGRALAQVHDNSVYSFATVVAIFILAIALGAQLARILLARKFDPQKALGTVWIVGGLATVVAPFIFVNMTGLKYTAGTATAWIPIELIKPVLMCICIPVIFLSAGLPLILHKLATESERRTGDLTGLVLTGNIAGSVAGALAGGFLFPSTLGLWRTVIAAGTISLAAGSLLGARTQRGRLAFATGFILIGGLALITDLPRTRVDPARGEKLLALAEGTHGIVSVVERGQSRRLKLNNHYVLGGTSATGDERMQAHIPLFLHPNPAKVVFLGYGTGITANGAAYHPIKDILAVELVPEVTEMALRYFPEAETPPVGSRPQVLIEDARNFLRGTKQSFDVIIGDLVVPWRPGEGALYTWEQFKIARERLAPGGIYCAWLPMFQLSRADFLSLERTFRAVFPHVSVWRGDFSPNEPALALIGSIVEHLDPKIVEQRLSQARLDPLNPQLKHSAAFWMHFVGVLPQSDYSVRLGFPLNTENRPVVELRRARLEPFVGRALQHWSADLRERSVPVLPLAEAASKGWAAGVLMSEFTHLTSEGRRKEAAALQQDLRDTLGAEIAQSVFGP